MAGELPQGRERHGWLRLPERHAGALAELLQALAAQAHLSHVQREAASYWSVQVRAALDREDAETLVSVLYDLKGWSCLPQRLYNEVGLWVATLERLLGEQQEEPPGPRPASGGAPAAGAEREHG